MKYQFIEKDGMIMLADSNGKLKKCKGVKSTLKLASEYGGKMTKSDQLGFYYIRK